MKEHHIQPAKSETDLTNQDEIKRMLSVIQDALEEGRGHDIAVLDVTSLTDICDYMIVVTGASDRQIKTLADKVLERMHDAGWHQISMEGDDAREWVLVDFVDIVVHIMRREARKRYDLENLWNQTFARLLQGDSTSNPVSESGLPSRNEATSITQAETGVS